MGEEDSTSSKNMIADEVPPSDNINELEEELKFEEEEVPTCSNKRISSHGALLESAENATRKDSRRFS